MAFVRSSLWRLGLAALLSSPACAATYRVRAGDTLSSVAAHAGTSVAQLRAANPGLRGSVIKPGQPLHLPSRSQISRVQSSRALASGHPWLWPLPGYHQVSSGYGARTLEGQSAMHYGLDILAPLGTPVLAARSGRVLESRRDMARGWGWTVVVQHPDGWVTRYAHLSRTQVQRGQLVRQGQCVGRVGSTGRSTGVHLHYGTYRAASGQGWVPHDPLRVHR